MSSFLDKLNDKISAPGVPQGEAKPGSPPPGPSGSAPRLVADDAAQNHGLDIDLFVSPTTVMIYGIAPGVDQSTLEVTLDAENDALTIKGSRLRPARIMVGEKEIKAEGGKFIKEECKWDSFYRRVTLPGEVNMYEAEVILKNGVLVIVLPLTDPSQGKKLKIVELRND